MTFQSFYIYIYRTKCNACYAISKDIEAAKFILKQPSKNGPIVEEVCENLGSNHLPYSWIETYCDEIMDDYAGKIYITLIRRLFHSMFA